MPYRKEYKPILGFEYPCYVCGQSLSSARIMVNHLLNIHGYEIPTRLIGHKRPPTPGYIYLYNSMKADEWHFACASCWFHCPKDNLEELEQHMIDTHHPKNIDPTKNTDPPSESDKSSYVPTDEEEYELESSEAEEDREHKSSPVQAVDTMDILNKLSEISELFNRIRK